MECPAKGEGAKERLATAWAELESRLRDASEEGTGDGKEGEGLGPEMAVEWERLRAAFRAWSGAVVREKGRLGENILRLVVEAGKKGFGWELGRAREA